MNEYVFSGMLAELIELFAERKGVSPSDYVLSFFDTGCNAPMPSATSFSQKVQCTDGQAKADFPERGALTGNVPQRP